MGNVCVFLFGGSGSVVGFDLQVLFFATNKKTSSEERHHAIRPYVFPSTRRRRFPLDGGRGMGLVRPAFMEMNQFSFLHLDFWMPGVRAVGVRSACHIPPDRDL
jgi:hypothetical protein